MKLLAFTSQRAAQRGTTEVSSRKSRRVSLAAIVASLFAASGCNDYGNTFQTPTGAPISFHRPIAGQRRWRSLHDHRRQPIRRLRHSNRRAVERQNHPNHLRQRQQRHRHCLRRTDRQGRHRLRQHPQSLFRRRQQRSLQYAHFPRQPRRQSRPGHHFASRPPPLLPAAASFTLTVTGSNFIPTSDPSGGSQVRFNLGPTQTSLPILNVTSTQITATVDSSLLVNATSAPVTAIVTVYNPPAAGTPAGNGSVAKSKFGWRRHEPRWPDLHRESRGHNFHRRSARRSSRRHSRRQRRRPLRRLRRHARRPLPSFCARYLRRRRLRLPVPHLASLRRFRRHRRQQRQPLAIHEL